MSLVHKEAKKKVKKIKKRKLTIYSVIEVGDPELWFTGNELEEIVDKGLKGTPLKGLAIRTRSRFVKEKVCDILGYQIPNSFRKVQPRFYGQNFDTYIQKSNNLQIWNEEISPERRYVLIKVSEDDIIDKVKVVNGKQLSEYDRTGTLTQKYQAKLDISNIKSIQISSCDTEVIKIITNKTDHNIDQIKASPIDEPEVGLLLAISTIYKKLLEIVGQSIDYSGADQERIRGAELHKLVCKALGCLDYQDDGKFPDIKNQLLEIKLQTSPTIDLGLVSPDSNEFLDINKILDKQIRHYDVRYAIFYGSIENDSIVLKNILISTGKDFFSYFKKFGGNVLNKKIQIPLPKDFF